MPEHPKGPDAEDMRRTVEALEGEILVLRSRLLDAPRRAQDLEERLVDLRGQLAQALSQNDKLAAVLEEAREQLTVLRAEVEKLTTPPNNFGTILQVNEDGTIDVLSGNRKLRVTAQPTIEVKQLQVGQEVLLNDSFNVVDVRSFEPTGEVVRVREKLPDGRLVVIAHADDERVVSMSDPMKDVLVRAGDYVRLDTRTGLAFERLARPEVEELVLEEVPDITYQQVGGLADEIEAIRDAVELPYVHRDLFEEYGLVAPKG
ncbi:MAG: proteasome ATPase, partial [Acidimicrobiia bacterium]